MRALDAGIGRAVGDFDPRLTVAHRHARHQAIVDLVIETAGVAAAGSGGICRANGRVAGVSPVTAIEVAPYPPGALSERCRFRLLAITWEGIAACGSVAQRSVVEGEAVDVGGRVTKTTRHRLLT